MGENTKNIGGLVLIFLVIWGIIGLINGDGFFGGIIDNIQAIGNIIVNLIQSLFVIGIIWVLILIFRTK